MAKQQVTVPDIGGAEGAEVIELLVAVGDEVSVEQGLIVLESDKASMEIPSSHGGKVLEMLVSEGDELAEGSPILVLETAGDDASADDDADNSPAPETAPETQESAPTTVSEAEDTAAQGSQDDSADEEKEAAGGESKDTRVPVPDIGTEEAVDLIEVNVAVGDTVAEGDPLVVLESDKASMEVPSPAAGEVLEILVKEGDEVRQGDELLVLRVSGQAAAADQPAPTEEPSAPKEAPADSPAPSREAAAQHPGAPREQAARQGAGKVPARRSGSELVYAGPAVRKLARELGVELDRVNPSGPRERVLKEDVQAFVKKALTGQGSATGGMGIPAVPEVDFAAFGEIETVARSKMDKLTAANMHRSWLNVPHVTQFDEADITELEAFRKSLKDEAETRGTRLTPVPFLLKACAIALRDNPKFCASASADGESLIYKHYIHIGMAVDTPAGLVVPVIRDVDKKTLWELAEEVLELAGKARDRKLKPAEMQGGCFSISSLGSMGGTGFTPIVNTPEVGILAVSRAQVKPVWDGSEFVPRTLLPLGLSYDHRVINGGDAGRFCTQLVGLLSDIRRLLL